MTTMITEVYDALLSAGADDVKARRAAEVMAGHEDRFEGLEHHIDKLRHYIDTVETRLNHRIDAVEIKLGQRIDGAEVTLTRRIDAVDANLDVVKSDLGGRITLLQWQLALLIGGVTAIVLKLFLH